MAKPALARDMRECLGTQRLAARGERVRKAAIRDLREPGRTHIDLAVDETLLVAVREPLGGDDAIARRFEMIDRPLRRIFAVGLFTREEQAGVAEASDLPDQPPASLSGSPVT